MPKANGFTRDYFVFEFPLSEQAWHRYAVRAVLPDDPAGIPALGARPLRELASRMNAAPQRRSGTEPALPAELLLALRSVNRALRWVATGYLVHRHPGSLEQARERVGNRLGSETVGLLYQTFVELFPPLAVQMARTSPRAFLAQEQDGISGVDRATIEMLLLFLNRANPAARTAGELFEDSELRRRASFVPFVTGLEDVLEDEEPPDPAGGSLFTLLRAPMQASPHSLQGQIRFMQENWQDLLPPDLLEMLQRALDVLQEVDTARAGGAGPAPVLEFGPGSAAWDADQYEIEAFSTDADWMSNVVLMAKSVYVWLDQLARTYQRPVRLLSDVPDEELDRLARAGINGLWLIGLWERSDASRKIKQYMGNAEAAASAYALRQYRIADDLGGEDAWADLSERARSRGIRLASDMVPNHMGLDSDWVVHHPEYFLQTEHPPYPAYSFTGGDLCEDPDVAIRIEDGYWNHSDAAVVFQRVDQHNGHTCYIYHGNDGTSMPWNDTAQLNFLLPQVREAVIGIILDVARKFPIIRFDAAMTLARKHYQRLWFPAPGDAGAIPSRAEHGMSKPEFEQVFPVEFWREVVDRVAAEVPDTLLLAEAFWLMEGFFVRTLGMHRVYNSAFMNMLKMEENQKYRQTIRNVLEYSPAILGRFVNFMNNPDEKTAVEQFGRGDKYFGCAVLLATMPGLPMLGHGQIEGFSEKYGMEYRRAYWDEQVDHEMVARHEREIFPLLRRRHLFSGSQLFRLFDFHLGGGQVNENVFAYSNGSGADRALVVYNNSYDATSGTIHHSLPSNAGPADLPDLQGMDLASALGLAQEQRPWIRFRDLIDRREYLLPTAKLHNEGFHLQLPGYGYRVLTQFTGLNDPHGRWSELAEMLAGGGSDDLERDLRRLQLAPLLQQLRADLAAGTSKAATAAWTEKTAALGKQAKLSATGRKEWRELLSAIEAHGILTVLHLRDLITDLDELPAVADVRLRPPEAPQLEASDRAVIEEEIATCLAPAAGDPVPAKTVLAEARYLMASDTARKDLTAGGTVWLEDLLDSDDATRLLGANFHDGVWYLRSESLERMLMIVAADSLLCGAAPMPILDARALILQAAEDAGYRLAGLRNALHG